MAILAINGVGIKDPSSLEIEIADVDASGERNAKGTVVRDRVSVKRKLYLTYTTLLEGEQTSILSKIGDEFFQVTYPDPLLGTTTKTFYVGNRKLGIYTYQPTRKIWNNFTLNFIER